jgi:succinyl-diaminopimelate desuccinylase
MAAERRPEPVLDLTADAVELTRRLVDIPSVSGQERELADAIEAALRAQPHLTVRRDGDALVASTHTGRARRVLLAGHIDTVPVADNLPARIEGPLLYGCGSSDMKAGVAVQLRLATLPAAELRHDVTFVFYDCEEVEAARNGLGRIAARHPDWLAADFAVLLEPTDGFVEGGCQGTLRADVVTTGVRAHSARAWLGRNAVHEAAAVLDRLARYQPREVVIDGLTYREGLNAVRVEAGVAGNVLPDRCVVTVNFRFAPDRDERAAAEHVREVFAGYELTVTDSAPGAPPGLGDELARSLLASSGRPARAKYGWTDVARFTALGVPAVNLGPGDPNLAHTRHEHVNMERIRESEEQLRGWLRGGTSADAGGVA